MTRSYPWLSAALVLTLAPACGDDKLSASGTGDTDATTGTEPEPTTTSATTGEPAFEPKLALGGLEVDWVEANQGIGVAIGRDGAWVGPADRTSFLLRDRLMLIRAFWKQLPPDWIPRPIEGRLIVTYPDGTEKVLSQTSTVEGESFVGNLDKSWYWGLMADEVVPGLNFRVELWETEAGYALLEAGGTVPPAGAVPPRLPHEGDALIGIEDSFQELKIVLVPFNYDNGEGCKTTPDTSESTMKLFNDLMFMMNPVERLEVIMHDPIDWNEPLTDFNELNAFMSGLRADEGAPPNFYYYGLVDVCSGGLGGAGGKAFGIPVGGTAASKADAWQRVSSGLSLPKNVEFSAETFVHEVGHSQGRYHVNCNGQEGGPDWSYPYEGGVIGEWGFGVINYKLYHPTVNKDYMTYCSPTWASTFAWNKTYPTIKTLSSWDLEGAPADPDAAILVGSIYPSGKETWITVPGDVHPEQLSAVHGVEFVADGATIASAPAAYLPQPEGDIVNVVVRLPADFDRVTQIVRVDGTKRTTTPTKAISMHHRPKTIVNE